MCQDDRPGVEEFLAQCAGFRSPVRQQTGHSGPLIGTLGNRQIKLYLCIIAYSVHNTFRLNVYVISSFRSYTRTEAFESSSAMIAGCLTSEIKNSYSVKESQTTDCF